MENQKKATWRTKNPMELANRMIACHMIKEIGVANIEKLAGIDDTTMNLFLLPIVGEDDNVTNEIDWETVLFKCSDLQLSALFAHFEPKKKEPKSSIIIQ
jgi:hypothetical protein